MFAFSWVKKFFMPGENYLLLELISFGEK